MRPRGCPVPARSIISTSRRWSGRRQDGRRGHPLRGDALSAAGPAVAARRAQHRAAARLGRACRRLIRETLAAGRAACRPLIARDGLAATLIEPALKLLQDKGASVSLSHELRELATSGERIAGLNFGGDEIALGSDDAVVMAVPPRGAATLVPGLPTPTKFRAIVNAHFRIDPPRDAPPILGVIGGLSNGSSHFRAASRSPSAPATG